MTTMTGVTSRPSCRPPLSITKDLKVTDSVMKTTEAGGCFQSELVSGINESKYRDLVKRAPEVDPACLVRTMFVSPKAGLNDRSEWKYVVNVQERDSRAKQVIRVDVCRSPDRSCSSVISLPFGYMSRCRQKYLKKKLLSLDSDGEGTSEDNFFVPSCCVCELVRDVSKK
ncbi:unnamed protein product [Ixodes pacificus]